MNSRTWLAWIVIAGAALRAWSFAETPLWLDEYGTAWTAGAGLAQVAPRALAQQGQSPLYYWLASLSTSLFGYEPVGLRLPSLFCGVALIAACYGLALRALGDRSAALAAAAACALSETAIWYAQDARPYSLALLAAVVAMWGYLGLHERRALPVVAWLGGATVAFYSHYLFAPLVAAAGIDAAWRRDRRRLGWVAAAAIACLPGVWQLASLAARRSELDWLGEQPLEAALRAASQLFAPPVLVAVLAVALLGGGWPQRAPAERRLIGLWLAIPIAGVALAPLFGLHLAHPRYLLVALPAALLLTGWFLGDRRALLVAFVAGALAFDLVPSLVDYGVFSRRPPEGWSLAARELAPDLRESDAVLVRTRFVETETLGVPTPALNEYLTWPIAMHLEPPARAGLVALPTEPAAVTAVLAEAARHPRIWLVGEGPLVALVQELGRDYGFAPRSVGAFTNVQLLLLTPEVSQRFSR